MSAFTPEVVGEKVAVIVHVAPAATVAAFAQVPPVIANCVPVVSAGVAEIVAVDSPPLVAVKVTTAEVLPTVVSVKVFAAIENEAGVRPVPEIARVAVCPAVVPSVKVRVIVSVFTPDVVGEKVAVTVHVAAAAIVAPLVHVPPVIANCVPVVSAGTAERVIVVVPLLVAVKVTALDVFPTVVSEKVFAAIENEAGVVPPPLLELDEGLCPEPVPVGSAAGFESSSRRSTLLGCAEQPASIKHAAVKEVFRSLITMTTPIQN